ncbi:MAG: 5-formyltetrahydrofolate cyclo-ligase [Lachnospiraceae bacterium]|nr:5-formyltetrahydrofolate cyclo-ligase [Lachnospiraceae bacterium]
MDDFADKKALRKKYLALRKELLKAEVSEKSGAICKRIMELPEYQAADVMLSYMSANNEVCTDIIISDALDKGRAVFLPVTHNGREMVFKSFLGKESELTRSRFGIKEPLCGDIFDEEKFIKNEQKIIIIMPGVAFDEERNRIGYGGGYYDRFLEGLFGMADKKNASHRIAKIAAAYEMQIIPKIIADEFDCKPDKIITEKRII